MVPFDPATEKAFLLGSSAFGFEKPLKESIEEGKAESTLGAYSGALLTKALRCWLVGLDDPAARLLRKAHQWVLAAIEANERPMHYFPDATEAERFLTLAMCNWLLHGSHDADAFQKYIENEDRYLLHSKFAKDKVTISLTLPDYANAGAWGRAVEIFEQTPKLSPPESLRKIRSEAQMVYVLCQHHLRGQFTKQEIAVTGEKFLSRNVETWLGNGHYLRAVQWLKILHWNDTDRTASPKEIVLKCYDYLPGRTRPA